MAIVLFIIIITALVFVHELGHFLFAKFFKMRVDEFAIGFPPRLFSFKKGETDYAVNLVPFGGYVKIFGENYEDKDENEVPSERSFGSRPRYAQVLVLIAGILFNIIFAWVLLSVSLYVGAPREANPGEPSKLMITDVIAGSPAAVAGLHTGDVITEIDGTKNVSNPSSDDIKEIVSGSDGKAVMLHLERGGSDQTLSLTPTKNVSGETTSYAIGVEMVSVSIKKLSLFEAIKEGFTATIVAVETTATGLYSFITEAFRAKANLSQVSGPIGIISLVGDASQFGLGYLISFAALISINLAVINIIPFPALDGGRILLVIIEAIKRKAIKAKTVNAINGVGFLILIGLMIVITYSDLARIFHF